MTQTAVEWFYEEIWKQFGFSCSSDILDKAKEMEKEQIINAWNDSHISMMPADQYYNETYKQN